MIYSQVVDLALCPKESRIYLGYHHQNEGKCLGGVILNYHGITRRSCLEAHMVLDMEYREKE
jgi:hypothetical protein